jgi:hypothetical protein
MPGRPENHPADTADPDPAGGWVVGDEVLFQHRLGFDARYLRGSIVDIKVEKNAAGRPVARFTVQIDPSDGAGRLQLDLPHLHRP